MEHSRDNGDRCWSAVIGGAAVVERTTGSVRSNAQGRDDSIAGVCDAQSPIDFATRTNRKTETGDFVG
jgi:hypothetical protein